MDKQLKEIEIPFGAKDSELCGWECTIPEGMEATIVDNKIVVKKKDSADERIINNIKKAVESYWSDEPLHEILDWLEKQGGKGTNGNEREIPISEQKSAEEYNITGIGSKNAQGKLGEMIKRKLEIEKQCYQKPAIKLERDDNGEAVLTPFEAELFSMMSEAWQGYSFGEEVNIAKIVKEHSKELLERANEQKPAVKTVLKFKVGDWVVNTVTKEVEQVIELTGCEYICSGHLIVSFNNQHLLKRWTIQDAKDGDVLVEDSCIFIIQKLGDNNTAAKTYCTLYNNGDFDDGSILYFDIDSTKPATKEQRDILFSKMKEAGYEWDAEKKELKKIGQNPAWSEEDENLFRCAIDAVKQESKVRTDGCLDEEVGEMVTNWLKSIKERVQPQNTWRPSDEQMDAIHYIYQNLNPPLSDKLGWDSIKTLELMYHDLKKL